MRHAWLAFVLAAASQAAFAATLTAGPMVGATDMHATTIWLQTDSAAKAEIEYWVASEVPMRVQRTPAVQLQPGEDHTARIRIADLASGVRYAYRLKLDGQVVGNVQHFQTQVRWQWKNTVQPPDFTALMGSCHYLNEPARDRDGAPFGAGFGIFATMAEKKPDLMLWLGDNSYLRENEWTSAEGIRYRWKADRAQPELQPLLRVGQHAATWDDHDYGPDDANSAYPLKQASLEMFKRYWANDSYGLPDAPGVFTTFGFSDVDFFLVDGRWYRDADKDPTRPDSKRMLGEAQVRWLKNALMMSTAPFKVIVGGTQFLATVSPRAEGWSHFPRERQDFLDWLTANRMDGVLFLSGDRHFTELSKLERPGSYPLYDLTCSPLTAGAFSGGPDANQPLRIAGTMVPVRNFCSFSVEGPKAQRTITLKSFDATGKELWSHAIAGSSLRTPRP